MDGGKCLKTQGVVLLFEIEKRIVFLNHQFYKINLVRCLIGKSENIYSESFIYRELDFVNNIQTEINYPRTFLKQ